MLLLGLCFLARGSFAAIEELEFASPDEEARYHYLIDVMRCPMCLNANLSGSDAPIAADLRAEIYKQIREGRSDEEIIEFMRARYGDFIMYRPPLNTSTLFLWFGPGVLLVLGFFVLRRLLLASRSSAAQESLSTEELQKLHSFLDDTKEQTRS
jgi:cytochrome c-type biogenesis protein CcmH